MCRCGNEPLALSLPSEPSVALEAGIPVNTSQISFLFSSFCVSVVSRQTAAGCRRGLTATSPLPPLFSCLLSSLPFSRSSVWAPLSCLLFCLIELFGRRACQTAPSMWGVWGAGGQPPLCSQRRVSFSPLLLHECTWPRLGAGGAGRKFMKYQESLWLFLHFDYVQENVFLFQSSKFRRGTSKQFLYKFQRVIYCICNHNLQIVSVYINICITQYQCTTHNWCFVKERWESPQF